MNTYAIKQKPQLSIKYANKQQLSNVYTKMNTNLSSAFSTLSANFQSQLTDLKENTINTQFIMEKVELYPSGVTNLDNMVQKGIYNVSTVAGNTGFPTGVYAGILVVTGNGQFLFAGIDANSTANVEGRTYYRKGGVNVDGSTFVPTEYTGTWIQSALKTDIATALSSYTTTTDMNDLIDGATSGKADKSDTYTKTEVDTAIDTLKTNLESEFGGAFQFKGEKDSLSAVQEISDPQAGDVYQVGDKEYAYSDITSSWVELGFNIDISGKADKADSLSGYGIENAYTKSQVDDAISGAKSQLTIQIDKKVDSETGKSLISDTDITKLSEIAPSAQVNIIEEIQIDSVPLTVQDKSVNISLSGKAQKADSLSGYGITDAYTKTEIDERGYLTEHQDISTKLQKVTSGHVDEIITAKDTGQIQNSGIKIGNGSLKTLITNAQLRQNIIDELGITNTDVFDIQVGSDYYGLNDQGEPYCDTIYIKINNQVGNYLRISYYNNQWESNSHEVFPGPSLYDTFEYETEDGPVSAQIIISDLDTDGSISKAGTDIPNNIIDGSAYTEIKIKTLSDDVIHTFGIGMQDGGVATELAVTKGLAVKADAGTTLSDYGIVDAYTKDEIDGKGYLTEHQSLSGKADTSDTLSGYGITNAYTKEDVDTLLLDYVPKTSYNSLIDSIVDALSGVEEIDQTKVQYLTSLKLS